MSSSALPATPRARRPTTRSAHLKRVLPGHRHPKSQPSSDPSYSLALRHRSSRPRPPSSPSYLRSLRARTNFKNSTASSSISPMKSSSISIFNHETLPSSHPRFVQIFRIYLLVQLSFPVTFYASNSESNNNARIPHMFLFTADITRVGPPRLWELVASASPPLLSAPILVLLLMKSFHYPTLFDTPLSSNIPQPGILSPQGLGTAPPVVLSRGSIGIAVPLVALAGECEDYRAVFSGSGLFPGSADASVVMLIEKEHPKREREKGC